MKKIFIKKSIAILLIVGILLLTISNNYVQATSQEQTNSELGEILQTEEKIVMYDAITKETTEVDMEQLRQEISKKRNSEVKITSNSIFLEPSIVQNMKQKTIKQSSSLRSVVMNPILDTEPHPYNNVCRIKTSEGVSGTAALVANNVVVTAAHCVLSINDNHIIKDWVVQPGSYDGNKYWGKQCGWTQVYYNENWLKTHGVQDDWAICILGESMNIGYLGLLAYDNGSALKGKVIRNFGYPIGGGYNGLQQTTSMGTVTDIVGNNGFYYNGASYTGMSGGPIVYNNDETTIIGIILGSTKNDDHRVGRRITKNMGEIISKYR